MVSQDSYLIKTSSPNTEISPTDQRKELVIEYKVREGDNLTKIARDFGISLNTLLWANNLESVSIIKVGQELRVLPIDGVLYTVKRGDTLIAISQKYKTNQEQVIDFNDLLADGSLKEGVELILPGGIMAFSETIAAKKPITQARATVNKTVSAVKQATKLAFEAAEKFFIIPVSGIITQGKHNYTPPAIDIGNSCGTSIFAAADGVATSIFETNSRSRYA
ncbi:MAG: Peptidase M23 family protein, partial [Parcubacteria group bacterium GW2011_GWC2_36_17]